jgi:hypothetical protein
VLGQFMLSRLILGHADRLAENPEPGDRSRRWACVRAACTLEGERPPRIRSLSRAQKGTPVHRFQPSEGAYLYLLGLVIVATHPGRFWLGFMLAIVPLVIGPLGRAFGGRAWRNA